MNEYSSLATLQASRRVGAAAGTSGSVSSPPPQSPPQQPASREGSATPSGPGGMAAATQLLESIPRARTVQELRGVLQQAQAQGCSTTAHSLAAIMQLGNLAAASPTPSGAEEARQLGTQLARGLRGQANSLAPALRVHIERALAQLELSAELGSAISSPSGPGLDGPSPGSGTPPGAGATAAPARPADGGGGRYVGTPGGGRGRAGPGWGKAGGPGRANSTGLRQRPAEPAGPPVPRMPPPAEQPQQPQQQAQGRQENQQRRQHQWQSKQQRAQQQGQRPPARQRQQAPDAESPGAGAAPLASATPRPPQLHVAVRQSEGTQTAGAADSAAPGPIIPAPPPSPTAALPTTTTTTTTASSSTSNVPDHATTPSTSTNAAPTSEPNPIDPHAHGAATDTSSGVTPSEAAASAAPSEAAPSQVSAAGAPDEEQAFQEALLAGWSAWRDLERSRARGTATGAGGANATRGHPQLGVLQAALQRRPASELAVGDVAEVVHLMTSLRLMPRYEWLQGAQERLRGEMVAVEVAAGTATVGGTYGEASALLEDLRQVYGATEELMQMCWEADSRPAAQEAAATEEVAAPELAAAAEGGDGASGPGQAGPPPPSMDQQQQQATQAGEQQEQERHAGAAVHQHSAVSAVAEETGTPPRVGLGGGSGLAQGGAEAAAQDLSGGSSGDIRVQGQGSAEGGEGASTTTWTAPEDAAVGAAAEPVPAGNGGTEVDASATTAPSATAEALLAAAGAASTTALASEQPSAVSPRQPAELGGVGSEQTGAEAEAAPPSLQALEVPSGSAAAAVPQSEEDPEPPGVDDSAAALARLEALLQQARSEGVVAAPELPLTGRKGAATGSGTAAVQVAIADLASLLATVLQEEAAASRAALLAAGGATIAAATGPKAGLAAAQVGPLVAAARAAAAPAPLPPQLLSAAARLLAAQRGAVACQDLAPVLGACVDAGYTPPSHLLGQLAGLAFPSHANPPEASEVQQRQQHQHPGAPTAASVRALHECGSALGRLGCRLNTRQFSDWVHAVARRPLALAPPQLSELLAACTERGLVVRPAGFAAALAGAATQPPARLQRLSVAEAAAVARFAAQQGLQLAGGDAVALLEHLSPRLRELDSEELAGLLPALRAAGVLPGGGAGGDAATSAWLGAHSAALLPLGEALAPDVALSLLRCYDQLGYRPPALLLLGVSLALESHLASAPLPALLAALHLLLCRLGFAPNEGLAVAIQERLVPRLMLAAAPPPLAPGAAAAASSGGLTMRQRLAALDVLAAARVRPHPAQLAALLEVELAGGKGRMAATLSGDELVRLLWLCTAFRALPSWRFIGEWLEAFARAIGGASGNAAAAAAAVRVSPGALARAGWCLAQMGVQPEQGWQAVYQAALAPAMSRLGAEELSLVGHSALLLRSRPSGEWLEALLRAALGRLEEEEGEGLDAASAARLLHFAAAAEVEVTKDWMQSFFQHTLHLLARPATAAADAAAGSPDQVALMLRALAQLGFRPPEPWLAAALKHLRDGAAALSPACFPVALMSLTRLCPDLVTEPGVAALAPGGVVDELARAAFRKRAQFTALEMTWLMDALTCCPEYELPEAAAAGLVAALQQRDALEAGRGAAEEEEAEAAEAGRDVAVALGDAVSAKWLRWGGGSVLGGEEEA